MAVARFNLTIRFQHESNESWKTCAIARLVRDGQGGWRQDPQFIPPMVLFSASPILRERLVLLNRQLRSRRQRLMSMRRESNERLADFAVADVSLFWLLNALNSHARVLTEYERFPARHPEQVWAELARLAGSMLTFSLDIFHHRRLHQWKSKRQKPSVSTRYHYLTPASISSNRAVPKCWSVR